MYTKIPLENPSISEPGSFKASVEVKMEGEKGEEGEGVKQHCLAWRYS